MATKMLDALGRELHQVVEAVEQAANRGMAQRDQPQAVAHILNDCQELLQHVMDASVLEN